MVGREPGIAVGGPQMPAVWEVSPEMGTADPHSCLQVFGESMSREGDICIEPAPVNATRRWWAMGDP